MMSQEWIRFLDGLGRFGWRLGLDNIRRLCSQLGNPQELFPAIHIAGTNGKGSTAAVIERVLRAAGYRTGLYTSPHLVEVTERIRVDGLPISWTELGGLVDAVRAEVERMQATYFETLTAVAFRYFADRRVDVAVVEVGLGGRLDATNVVHPTLTVVTPIALDHCEHLGSTIEEIAAEKAGILRAGVTCVAAAMPPPALNVLRRHAAEVGSRLVYAPDICRVEPTELLPDHTVARLTLAGTTMSGQKIGLPGRYQLENVVTAMAAVEALREQGWQVRSHDLAKGLEQVFWPARLQRVAQQPGLVLDVAHNPDALDKMLRSLREIYMWENLHVVLGVLVDRPAEEMIRMLRRAASKLWCVPLPSDRSTDAAELKRLADIHSLPAMIALGPAEAVEQARNEASADDLICVTGSHYAVAPVVARLSEKDLTIHR